MRINPIFFAFLLIVSIHASNAVAKLAPTHFDDMVKESDLIVIANPESIFSYRNGSGYADLKIERVLKGRYDKAELNIRWSNEVHESKVRDFSDKILFLRQQGGEFVATHYGRGIWSIATTIKLNEAGDDIDAYVDYVEYRYPVDVLAFDKGVVKSIKEEARRRAEIGDCKQDEKVKGIYMDELIAIILNNEK